MTDRVKDSIVRWLDEAGMAMGGVARERRDALLELESAIYDRVDEKTRSGQVPEEAVQDVLDALGDPAQIGSSYLPVRPLVEPHQTRPFLFNLAALFAVHFLIVIGASVTGVDVSLPLVPIEPIADPASLLQLLGRAGRTLMFDAGLLLCVFAIVPRLGRLLRVSSVRRTIRRRVESAFFLGLVLVVLNFFRDNLLALYLTTKAGTTIVPLVGPGIVDNIILLNLWLGLAIAREVGYVLRGEQRWTLALDVVSNIAGLFCLLRMVATKRMVDLAAAHEALGARADTLGSVLNSAFTLLALATAALLAARLVRRSFRLAIAHGT